MSTYFSDGFYLMWCLKYYAILSYFQYFHLYRSLATSHLMLLNDVHKRNMDLFLLVSFSRTQCLLPLIPSTPILVVLLFIQLVKSLRVKALLTPPLSFLSQWMKISYEVDLQRLKISGFSCIVRRDFRQVFSSSL